MDLKHFEYRGDQATLGQRFKEWLEMFDYAVLLNKVNPDMVKAYFISHIGDDLRSILRSKRKSPEDSYEDARKLLLEHLKPHRVVFTEVHKFRKSRRLEGEAPHEFALRLRGLARHCEFKDIDGEILQQFVSGYDRYEIERKLISTDSLTLEKALDIATMTEGMERNLKELHGAEKGRNLNHIAGEDQASVNALKQQIQQRNQHRSPTQPSERDRSRFQNNATQRNNQRPPGRQHQPSSPCPGCGGPRHEKRAEQCKAWGKTCNKCNTPNHFASVCRASQDPTHQQTTKHVSFKPNLERSAHSATSRRVNSIGANVKPPNQAPVSNERVEIDAAEYAEYVRYKKATDWMEIAAIRSETVNRLNEGPRRTFHLAGQDIDCLVDTGAPVNVIDEHTYASLDPKPELSRCSTSFYPYGEGAKTPLAIIGQFTAQAQYKAKTCQAGFIVVR